MSPVGVQFIQPRVTTADAADVLLDDAIGPWWAVIVWGNSPKDVLPARSIAQLKRLGARLVAIVPETQRRWLQRTSDDDVLVLGDESGAVKKWFDDRPTPMVFLRPDRFVAGACLTQDGPATLDAILAAMSVRGDA